MRQTASTFSLLFVALFLASAGGGSWGVLAVEKDNGSAKARTAPTAEDAIRNIRPVQGTQEKLGSQLLKTSDGMREVLEEVLQNLVELQSKEPVKAAAVRLDDIGTKRVHDVVDALHRARKEQSETKGGLQDAMKGQDIVIKELTDLLKLLKREVAPAMGQRLLAQAIKKQEEALTKTKETRITKDNLEGKPKSALNEEDKKALGETNEKQKEATDELEKAMKELKAQAQDLKQSEPLAAANVQKAMDKLESAEAPKKSNEAQTDITDNKLRSAEQKEQDVLAALREADKQLSQNTDKTAQLENLLQKLKETKEKQEQALNETKNLDPKNDKALADNVKDQGDVSKALNELKNEDQLLAPAEQQSNQAQQQIADNKLPEAQKNQEKVLDALNEAIKRAEDQLAGAQDQQDKAAELAQQLNKIEDLRQQQQDLKNQTDKTPPNQAQGLAPKEQNLAQQAQQLGQEMAQSQPQDQNQQTAQQAVQEAQQAMQAAAKDLGNQQPEPASKQEQKAIEALDKAEQATMAALKDVDPNAAMQQMADQIQGLAEAQAQLAQQTAEAPQEMGQHAPEQGGLAEQAHAEAGGMPEPAHQAMGQAEQAMQQAAQAMAMGQVPQAEQSQAQAMQALAQAQAAMAQAMGQHPEKSHTPKMTKSPGKQHEAGVGQFQYGKLGDMHNSVWNVMLPPKERVEVEQALKGRMPAKYAKQIKLYYQNLAGAKAD